jgi:hypothetical protein
MADAAEVLVPGDMVDLRAEVRRVDHDGKVVTLVVPAILGGGQNYIVAPPGSLTRVETRRGVRTPR